MREGQGVRAASALAADPNSAEAHASMAAALFFGDWNVPEAEREIARAIELNPELPDRARSSARRS